MLIIAVLLATLAIHALAAELPEGVRVTTIALERPCAEGSAGGVIAADLDDDGRMELLVTAPGYLGAYSVEGRRLWSCGDDIRVGGSSEAEGLPGHHGPGVQVAEAEAGGVRWVLYLTKDGALHARNGADGKERWVARPPAPEGAEAWEHLVVVNLRGEGDRDLLLQATNRRGYRMGRYVAAFRLEDLQAGRHAPLWQRDDFLACAHNGARAADLDGDGRDEIIGGTLLKPDGEVLYRFPVVGHLDSVFVYDVRPDLPGLEVVALEEGGRGEETNRVFLAGIGGLIWQTHHQHTEPQNAAVGRFSTEHAGLQVWCRSRYDTHQKPFVFDAEGKLIAAWQMDDVAPPGWTEKGVEVIWCVDWTGEDRQYAAAKERHESGDVCVFDPITGRFVARIPEAADRLYVADVLGDWREELIVWNRQELHIFENTAPNPRPQAPRLWERPEYRRAKMTYNYYSP